MGTTGKRLFQYAMLYNKSILAAMVLLVLAVCAELTGPLIAKRMIDQNILGVEKQWHKVESKQPYAVNYKDQWYKRTDRFEPNEAASKGAEVRVLQVGRSYYFLNGALAFEGGKREVTGSEMTVRNSTTGENAVYPVTKLTKQELYAFYKPEIPSLFKLAALYMGLLVLVAIFSYGQRLILQTSANKIVMRMRNDVFAHTQRLPVNYYDNLAAGQVVSRITNDTESIRELYVGVLANFLPVRSIWWRFMVPCSC